MSLGWSQKANKGPDQSRTIVPGKKYGVKYEGIPGEDTLLEFIDVAS